MLYTLYNSGQSHMQSLLEKDHVKRTECLPYSLISIPCILYTEKFGLFQFDFQVSSASCTMYIDSTVWKKTSDSKQAQLFLVRLPDSSNLSYFKL